MAEPVVLAALMLDAAIGWPERLYRHAGHPVGAFARVIAWGARRWNRPAYSARRRLAGGALTLLLVMGVAVAAAWAAEVAMRHFFGSFSWFAIALLAFPAIAQRSLFEHARPVLTALNAGDLSQARQAVGKIVGRDTANLDHAGISRAAIESLAESLCDGVVAPLFWLMVLGLPGVWAFKATSTADSLIGHKEDPWGYFGRVAARTDDIANFIPARITGILICLAGWGGWQTMWRDHANHASPNAGWPEAAMAGALGVWLAGPASYDGETYPKPVIGAGGQACAADLRRAIGIYIRACALVWMAAFAGLIGGGWAWPV
ncbi:adenosylcobinamide-phosphate synthase CbiB [Croceicoccus mobilis]|uniref:Cobalamin biosynthesis protein CobD n=1 Tax=Croceicoccus mobilis TaxID=1703339 RepID=A0A916Z8X3_9SPHN|nr:adenosylcobinamide-phosphate synthase CbiB [Croceicoccus mobilis]GGD81568.1 cobalamin biosynthesis protein CobD [Croceicoccus mobilis]